MNTKKTTSLLQNAKECYLCKMLDGKTTTDNLESHHVMNGPSRGVSEKWGGVIWLCQYHHTVGGKACVHENYKLRKILKQQYQKSFELLYGEELWMKLFHKNYKEEL